jgi:hypothetical protein
LSILYNGCKYSLLFPILEYFFKYDKRFDVERVVRVSAKRKIRESGYVPKKLVNADWIGVEGTEPENKYDPRYGLTNRRFRLFHLLILSPCTCEDIFVYMKDFYKLNGVDGLPDDLALQRARRMFQRDLLYIEKMGYKVERYQRGDSIFYQVAKTIADT